MEERAQGGEASVAGRDRHAAHVLDVVEERADERSVEVLQAESLGADARPRLDEAEQKPERVAVGGDGVGAGAQLADETLGEERLEAGGEVGHRPILRSWRRRAAAASRGGEAERCQ